MPMHGKMTLDLKAYKLPWKLELEHQSHSATQVVNIKTEEYKHCNFHPLTHDFLKKPMWRIL